MKDSIIGRLFNGKKNIIWGAGWKGAALFLDLISYGVYVTCFCDSNKRKQSIRLYNKKIISKEELSVIKDECNIIIATDNEKYKKEIAEELKSIGINEVINSSAIKSNIHPLPIAPIFLYRLILDSYKRKIIIYGYDRQAEEIEYILSFLDVEVAYIVEDDENSRTAKSGRCIHSVYELIHEKEDKILVVVTDQKIENIPLLLQLGLSERVSYNVYSDYRRELARKNVLDPNLGFNFISADKNIPGFNIFGSDNPEYTVVTLGGSTTDSNLYTFSSWPRLLYEKLKQNGYSVKVICGGCLGYKTSQELIKLIRDVLPMKPDLVIEYGGINDAALNRDSDVYEDHPFLHRYQIDFFQKASSLIRYEYNYLSMDQQFILGPKSPNHSWGQYFDNIKAMNAVSQAFGVEFHAFLQPYLGIKKGRYSNDELELILNTGIRDELVNYINDFYTNLEFYEENYITDMSHLFDECDQVYLDFCHVNLKGNTIIAEKMYDYVVQKIGR